MRRLFTRCTPCDTSWNTREVFLHDPDLDIIEYRTNFDNLTAGTFVFKHVCGAALSLPVREFNGLYEGPVFNHCARGDDECPGYCLYKNELRECAIKCECAYVRNIIGIIKSKKAAVQ